MEGPSPGLILGDTGAFVPFVIEEETQFCLLPMLPPPTLSARHSGTYASSMRVIDMNKCGSTSLKPTELAFNPLVSKLFLKRTAKRVAAAERNQRKLLLAGLRKAKLEKQRLLEEKRKLAEEKKLLRARTNRSNYIGSSMVSGRIRKASLSRGTTSPHLAGRGILPPGGDYKWPVRYVGCHLGGQSVLQLLSAFRLCPW
jgi:hypothetical protein